MYLSSSETSGTLNVARALDAGLFSTPVLVPVPSLAGSSLYSIRRPRLRFDGKELCFEATISADLISNVDIFCSQIDSGTIGTPTPQVQINNIVAFDGAPVFSADGITMYFASDRTAGQQQDIYASSRVNLDSRSWGAPLPTAELNSTGTDEPAWVSPDGCTMYLISDRDKLGRKIYVATR
jgi:hypothetical protein